MYLSEHSDYLRKAPRNKKSTLDRIRMNLIKTTTFDIERTNVPPKVQKRRDEKRQWAPLKASEHSLKTVNPIRKICDAMSVPSNPEKTSIQLNLGDPTLTGNLPPCEVAVNALKDIIDGHKFDGYGPAIGNLVYFWIKLIYNFAGVESAREAVASHFSCPESPINADDVVLASGCSHAIEMAIVAMADPGENILVPIPGFPLYSTLCKPNGIEPRQYKLKMNDGGLIDLKHLEEMIDLKTRAIIINNPSNPTGVVFPKEHLEDILKLAYKHKVNFNSILIFL